MNRIDDRDAGDASGRFLLRLDPGLHAALRTRAGARGISLNELCARTLAAHAFESDADGFGPVLRRALALFEGALVGIVAIGSWARGEAADTSDVDVLVVVGPEVPITRALYRRWDAEPLRLEGRVVDPHLIALPDRAAPITGVWSEAARDGIVVFERGHAVSRHLGHVRRHLLAGGPRRAVAHGQPYWAAPRREESHAQP